MFHLIFNGVPYLFMCSFSQDNSTGQGEVSSPPYLMWYQSTSNICYGPTWIHSNSQYRNTYQVVGTTLRWWVSSGYQSSDSQCNANGATYSWVCITG